TTDFVIVLTGLTSAKTIAVAGGFPLDFGASLGGLASVQTTGDVIPLAELVASATFGINLSPTSSITVSPGQFQAGPRVDATTTSQGGHSISIDLIRPGGGPVGAALILTVKAGGGTFKLGSTSLAYNATAAQIQTALTAISASYAGSTILVDPQPAGTVYTITL